MTAFNPVYRLRVYEPRSASVANGRDPNVNPALLTPASGAPHSDVFQVATAMGVTGFKPIMGMPKGRRSGFDAATTQVDSPEITVDLLDINAVSGGVGNAELWVSAFIGNTKGDLQIAGCLVMIEQSLDGGTSWNVEGRPYAVGRVSSLTLTRPRFWTLKMQDTSVLLNQDIFATQLPAGDRAQVMLWPYGLTKKWNGLGATEQGYVTGWGVGNNPDGTTGRVLQVDVLESLTGLSSVPQSWVNESFADGIGNNDFFNFTQAFHVKEKMRAVFTTPDGTVKHMYVALGKSVAINTDGVNIPVVRSLSCVEVPAGDPYYVSPDSAYSLVAAGGARVYIMHYESPGATPTNPLLLEAHPIEFLQSLLYGIYGRRGPDGVPLHPIPYDSAELDVAKFPHIPMGYWNITKPEKLGDFLTKSLCPANGFAYVIEPYWDGVNAPKGFFRLIDTSTETVLKDLTAVTSITDADLVSEKPPTWQHNRKDAVGDIQVKWYRDFLMPPEKPTQSNTVAKASEKVVQSVDNLAEKVTFDPQGDIGTKTLTIDAIALRTSSSLFGRIRTGLVQAAAMAAANRYRPFARGPLYMDMTCLRTTASACRPGDWRFNETSYLPDASTNTRGGKRLMLCLRREDDGLHIKLRFLDYGVEGLAAVPSFGAQTIGSHFGLVRSIIMTNAAFDSVEVQYAETDVTQTVAPAAASAAWMPARVVHANSFEQPYAALDPYAQATADSSDNFIIVHRPEMGRMWIRGRSIGNLSLKQKSAWVVAAPVDTNSPAAPTGLTISAITTKGALLSWTNANALDTVEVWLGVASAGTAGLERVAVLLPGSTAFQFSSLDALSSTSLLAGLRHHRESSGLRSAYATVAFSTAGATTAADSSITAVSNASPYNGLAPQAGDTVGLRIFVVPGFPGHAIEVQETDDSAGTPNLTAIRNVATIAGDQVKAEGLFWTRAPLPLDGLTRWYRVRHHSETYTPGAWSAWVSSAPVVLREAPSVRVVGAPTASLIVLDNSLQVSESFTLTGGLAAGSLGTLEGQYREKHINSTTGALDTGAWSSWATLAVGDSHTVTRDANTASVLEFHTRDTETGQVSAIASAQVAPSNLVPGTGGITKTLTIGPADFRFRADANAGWYVDHDAVAGRCPTGSSNSLIADAPLTFPVGSKIVAIRAKLFRKTSADAADLDFVRRTASGFASSQTVTGAVTASDFTPAATPPVASPGSTVRSGTLNETVAVGDRYGLTLALVATPDAGAYPAGLESVEVDYVVFSVG